MFTPDVLLIAAAGVGAAMAFAQTQLDAWVGDDSDDGDDGSNDGDLAPEVAQ
jgi:hypothetical protein